MGNIRILIVEDELIIAEDIRAQLEDLGYEVITHIPRNYQESLDTFNRELPDLILLDIIIAGERDGIDLAERIREISDVPVIFLTSHADQATVERAKNTHPDAYIVKPFEKKDLYASIEIALHNSSERTTGRSQPDMENGILLKDAIFIKKDYRLIKLKIGEILYLKSDGNYIEIHTTGIKHLVRSSLKDFLLRLPAECFIQVHKSYALNTDHLYSLDYATAQVGETEIPVGRKYIDDIKKALNLDL